MSTYKDRIENLLRGCGMAGMPADLMATVAGCAGNTARNVLAGHIAVTQQSGGVGVPVTLYYHRDYAAAVAWMRLADALDDMAASEIREGLAKLDDEDRAALSAALPIVERVAAALEAEADHG